MTMTINKTRTPVFFELIEETDNRFRKVKIKIAHTGENLNNTYFSKETLEAMSETLANIPIVGFIEKNADGDRDFSDHRQVIVVKKGDIDIEYEGHAYGFIPEDHNAQFEIISGKEWLTCEGYLWTKFKTVTEIFNDANGFKSQSMEIQDVTGEADDLSRMMITSGRFSALCILGEDVNPAMAGSTVQLYNEDKIYNHEINEMMMEFSSTKKNKIKEGESDLLEEIKFETTEKEVETVEDKVEETSVDPAVEPTVEEAGSDAEIDTDENIVEENVEDTETEDEALFSVKETEKGLVINFSLSHEDVRLGLTKAIYEKIGYDDNYVYPVEIFDDHAVYSVYNYSDSKDGFISVAYTKDEETINLGEITEVVAMFVTPGEADKIETDREEYAALQEQLEELQAYKVEKENVAKEAVLAEFAEVIGSEIQEEIRSNFSTYSIEQVEKEVAYQVLKVSKGEIKDELTGTRATNFSKTKTDGRYGALDQYFNK